LKAYKTGGIDQGKKEDNLLDIDSFKAGKFTSDDEEKGDK